MKSYTFEPSDLLFVRDARPIDTVGGHGARWPDSPLIFDAIHAALHRAFPEKQEPWEHAHRTGVSGKRDHSETNPRNQRFGGLATAGIFPVENGKWFFPRPADWREDDAGGCGALRPRPIAGRSNLPAPLTHGLASPCKPSKIEPKLWWSREAFASYLQTTKPADSETKAPAALYDSEWQTGIGIDAERQTQDGERLYSAEYLRLRDRVCAGFFATLPTKQEDGSTVDCIDRLFTGDSAILIGGQRRSCTVRSHPSPATALLPTGPTITGTQLKWILLTPAIFPAIDSEPGGWLPSWINATTGKVQLLDGPGKNKAKRARLKEGQPIAARLIAACVPRAVPLSGWSERLEAATPFGAENNRGPRATLLAVPAGSVFYFNADTPEEAQKLAAVLNWHSAPHFNRRSSLLGEKGLGLGLCAPW
jgi:hypothetical protein